MNRVCVLCTVYRALCRVEGEGEGVGEGEGEGER